MSITQLIVILVLALIVLGPDKLPMLARTVGKALAEFRRITGDFRSTIEGEMHELERATALKEIRETFPEHVHYDLQTQEATVAAGEPPAPPAVPAAEAEAPTPSGKPSNGEPTPV
jgi:sec-independent protein translocase protein TatB